MGRATIHSLKDDFPMKVGAKCVFCAEEAVWMVDRKLPGGYGSHIEVCEKHVKKYERPKRTKPQPMSGSGNISPKAEDLSSEERVFLMKHIMGHYAQGYILKTVRAWKEGGFASPEQALEHAYGRGEQVLPAHNGRPRFSYTNIIFDRKNQGKGFEATYDNHKGLLTYKEVADFILYGNVQQSLF